MSSQAEWVPEDVDTRTPNAARMYDYYLGGSHNFDCDRRLASKVLEVFPAAPELARRARQWLRIAVSTLAGEFGVDQFLDLGSGVPTVGNVHEIARQTDPNARVLYVDCEPVAVAHAALLTADTDGVGVVRADFTRPGDVLDDPVTRATLDLGRPVAVIFSCSLHLLADQQRPADVVAGYRDATVPGSYLAISHGTWDNRPDFARVAELYASSASNPFVPRGYAEIEALFDGYDLVPPGLVFTSLWRPDAPVDPRQARADGCYAGVGYRPRR